MTPAAAAAAAALTALSFQVREGGNVNLFFQDGPSAYHLRLANPRNPRILFAFPAGNSGVLLAFDASRAENRGLTWTPSRWSGWTGPGTIRGGRAELTADRSTVVLTEEILDSMRLIRDAPSYPREVKDRARLAAALGVDGSGWTRADAAVLGSTLTFTRRTLDDKNHYRAELAFEGSVRIEDLGGGLFSIRDQDGKPLRLTVSAGMDYAPLTPLPPQRLLAPAALSAYQTAPASSPVRGAFDRLRFLTYREKMLAGSHRFLTYFGRDTMLTTLLAWEDLSADAREAALRSVLDRLSPEGVVAHEEDIGGQAERDRVAQALALVDRGDKDGARRALEDLQAPRYDYKMIDGEPLLVLLAHRYLTDPALPDERREALLSSASAQGPAYRALLQRAMRRLAQDALPYARDPHPMNLIKLKHPTVGDWRDSDAGNGGGKYPGSVDAYLAPQALAVMAQTAKAAGIEASSLCDVPLERLAQAWSRARSEFEVSLTAAQARERLGRFLSTVPTDERGYYEKRIGPLDRIGPVRFTALALDADGRPIPVVSSDGVFALLLGQPSRRERSELVETLSRPYPLGLATEVGTVVANAAFSDRPGDADVFTRAAYHGAVIWGWQQTALIEGAERAAAPALAAQARKAVARAGDDAQLELWTFDPRPRGAQAAPFNLGASGDNEADPAQLWSSVPDLSRYAAH